MPSDKRARKRAAREAKLAELARQRRRKAAIRRFITLLIIALMVVGGIFIFGSSSPKKKTTATTAPKSTITTVAPTTTTTPSAANAAAQKTADAAAVAAGCPPSTSTRVNTKTWATIPPQTIDPTKTYTATITTDLGDIVIALAAKTAPKTVNNFVFLANQGYYNCVIFHRVIPGFMNQTGDPTGTGTGTPGYTIPDELAPAASTPANQFPLGSVAMANTASPNTGGAQFFIVDGSQGEGLGDSYSLFGQVTSGQSVADKINADGSAAGIPPNVTHRMLKVTVATS